MLKLQFIIQEAFAPLRLCVKYKSWIVFGILLSSSLTFAQSSDCGVADTINFPIDKSNFRLAQDFGTESPRHQGRYHTGEDWYGGAGMTQGQPVSAAARGRVTYTYSLGWGRDGGVVILEHTFPDGTIVYTQYGHMAETETYPFPTKFACVEPGQIIGVIGDVRPAPHLHFEVRINNPDVPGPGYSWEDPFLAGWRQASKFVTNMQARLQGSFLWYVLATDGSPLADYSKVAPPLILSDNSLLFFEGKRIKRATQDGRVLWRQATERQAVSVLGYQGIPIVAYADGTMQTINSEGAVGETWKLDVSLAAYPLSIGDWWLFPTTDGKLIGLSADLREIVWQMDNVPAFTRWQVAGTVDNFVIGMITTEDEILTISQSGEILDRAVLRESGSLTTAPDGNLLVYSRGGLWQINAQGDWSAYRDSIPSGGYSSAALALEDGQLFLFDGQFLYAYSADRLEVWSADLGQIQGEVHLDWVDNRLLLTSTQGNIIVLRTEGGVCNRTQVYGRDSGILWHNLGADGTLRIAIADTIWGFDWRKFLGGCAT